MQIDFSVDIKFERNCVERWKFVLQWSSTIVPEDVKPEQFMEGTKTNCFLGDTMDKVLENLFDNGCPKLHDLVYLYADRVKWICS